jgi:lysophospholipase L1-like esterase
MADRRGNSADRRWRTAGMISSILAALVLMGAFTVVQGRHEPPIPLVSSAPLGNQKPKRVVVIGDSLTESPPLGTESAPSGGAGSKSWPQLAFRQLRTKGVDVSAEVSGVGGSGYLARGLKGATFGEQARSLLGAGDDLVIVFGGADDALAPPEDVAAAVGDTFSQVRRASPRAQVIVVGPVSRAGDLGPKVTHVRDIVRDQAAKVDAIFVDPIAGQWLVGNPNLISNDGLRPTEAGHAYIAEKLLPIIQGTLAPAAPWSS